MLKYIVILWVVMLGLLPAANAQNPVLRVAVSHYQAPFVMQGANNSHFGYDVVMMDQVCKVIQRDCQYIPMRFEQLLASIEENTADVAVSGITITVDRLKRVNFSTPYLPSESRFIASVEQAKIPFSLQQLDNKRIGIQAGTILANQIDLMGIKNPTIVTYKSESDMIGALSDGKIDLVLVDAPSALYWQNRGTNTLAAYGPRFPFGLGYGVVLNQNNTELLNQINQALVQYKASNLYKTNYQMYIEEFTN